MTNKPQFIRAGDSPVDIEETLESAIQIGDMINAGMVEVIPLADGYYLLCDETPGNKPDNPAASLILSIEGINGTIQGDAVFLHQSVLDRFGRVLPPKEATFG